jgi:PhnB protein
MSLNAYRFFSNDCREAMTRYQEIFGGELQIMGFGDMPPGEDVPEGIDPNMVMHAALTFPAGDKLLASDDPSGDGGPVTGVSISYTAATIDDCKRIFDQLSDGGEVGMPLEEAFWSPLFGMCTDRFGTAWMVSVDHPAGN